MDGEEFVKGIRIAVRDGSIRSVLGMLSDPPKRMDRELAALIEWVARLPDREKAYLARIIKESVDLTVFNFLCVFDSVMTIEDTEEKGDIEIWFRKAGDMNRINGNSWDLHDEFKWQLENEGSDW